MSFFNRKGEVIVTEMARILTRIKEAEENNQKKQNLKKMFLDPVKFIFNPKLSLKQKICNDYKSFLWVLNKYFVNNLLELIYK